MFENLTLIKEKDMKPFPAWSQKRKQLFLEGTFAQFCLSGLRSFFKIRIFREAFLIPLVLDSILCFFFDISSKIILVYWLFVYSPHVLSCKLSEGRDSVFSAFVHVCKWSANPRWWVGWWAASGGPSGFLPLPWDTSTSKNQSLCQVHCMNCNEWIALKSVRENESAAAVTCGQPKEQGRLTWYGDHSSHSVEEECSSWESGSLISVSRAQLAAKYDLFHIICTLGITIRYEKWRKVAQWQRLAAVPCRSGIWCDDNRRGRPCRK